jgi:hypothetical protein
VVCSDIGLQLAQFGEHSAGLIRGPRDLASGKIAVELAPFVAWLSDAFVAAGTEGEGMGGYVRRGVDMMITAIGWALDAIDMLRTAWAGMKLAAQLALTGAVDLGAMLVKGVEVTAEGIASAFTWAWTRTQQAFTDTFAWITQQLANFLSWIESYLPESMQTGLGDMAQEFSKTFSQIADENRKAMEAKAWKVDFDMGADSSRAFADNMLADAKTATEEFWDFANRDKMSSKLQQKVDDIRAKAEEAAASSVPAFEGDETGLSDKQLSVGALERGSAAAMSAIVGTQKSLSLDQQNLEAQKRHSSLLDRIEKNTRTSLAPAGL